MAVYHTDSQLLPRPVQVAADASTSSRPLDGFTPRQGAGLAIFGRSNVEPPAQPVSNYLKHTLRILHAACHLAVRHWLLYKVPSRSQPSSLANPDHNVSIGGALLV